MALDAAAYGRQLLALLPRGRAWTRESGSVLARLMRGLGAEYARIDWLATRLLAEIDPRQAVLSLEEWERLLGLPDACSELAPTNEARRRAAHAKLVSTAGVSKPDLVRLAADLGYRADVWDVDETRARAVAAQSGTGISAADLEGGRWKYVWGMDIHGEVRYFNTLSAVTEPLATYSDASELICRIRAIAPAHTYPDFALVAGRE